MPADPVLVAGAGPVGLSAALALARFGVPAVVLEARDGPSGVGSRSICIQRDVLEIFDRLGCGQAMADLGVSWTVGRTYYRNVELFQVQLPATGDAAFPPFVNLQQYHTEAFLLHAAQAHPLVDVRFGHRVTGLRQHDTGVRVTVAGSDGASTVTGTHLIACDGPHSTVRGLLGIGFPGHSHPDRFIIADIRADLAFPNERRFFFDPPFNPGRQVLVHPQPEGVWRIDWQVPADTDAEEERATGRLDERIRAVVGDVDYELVWLSTYRFHQRAAERFARGRVFLAGDAAHVMSPFGARGMNSGVADAENIAWKLWLVRAGHAPERLLDTYDAERRPAAMDNLAITDATMRFMVPTSAWRWRWRNAVLAGSVRIPALRRLVNSGRLAQPAVYRRSPIVASAWPAGRLGTRPGPTPGSLAPDARCTVVGCPQIQRVRQLFGDGFVALFLPATLGSALELATLACAVPPSVPTTVAVVAPAGRHPVTAAFPAQVRLVCDPDGALRRAYRAAPDTLYVIRPDGYVAARVGRPEGLAVADLVDRCAGHR